MCGCFDVWRGVNGCRFCFLIDIDMLGCRCGVRVVSRLVCVRSGGCGMVGIARGMV